MTNYYAPNDNGRAPRDPRFRDETYGPYGGFRDEHVGYGERFQRGETWPVDYDRGRYAPRGDGGASGAVGETALMSIWPARIGLIGVEVGLRAWREFADVTRDLLRQQQDMMLEALRAPLRQADGRPNEMERSLRSGLREPMHRAAVAYERMGEDVLEAERRAQRRFARDREMFD